MFLSDYLDLSFNVGNRLRAVIESISSCAFFCTSGFKTKCKKQNPNVFAVVSDPAINKSTHIARS